jgi:hypothetical protein
LVYTALFTLVDRSLPIEQSTREESFRPEK